MFLALLSTCIFAIADIFFKKSFQYKVWVWGHEASGLLLPLSLSIYLILSYEPFRVFSLSILWFYCILLISDIIQKPLRAKIFTEEKLSVIIPYTNLSRIFAIILSFFIYQDVSFISLWVSILAVLTIILFSIDFKKLSTPRNLWKIFLVEILRTFGILFGGWMIISYTPEQYFAAMVLLHILSMPILIIISWQYQDIIWAPKEYWKNRTLASLWWFWWFLSLMVISDLWISLSILLWFAWIAMTLAASYIFLWDRPDKKNIFLTIIITLLVGIWYYFK